MEWLVSVALAPIGLLILFALVVIPVELVLKKVWPEGRLKNLFFDRTFQERHPVYWFCAWLFMMALLGTWVGLISSRVIDLMP